MEEFEPFHWYINDQSAKRSLATLLFFGLSLVLLIFLFLRFIRMHASFPSSNDDDDVSNSIVVTRQNSRRREMGGNVSVVVVAPAPAASSEVIKSLPISMHNCRRLSENTRLMVGGDDDCCICLGVFEDGEMIKVMPHCLHAFHSHCIDRWLSSRSTCPVCRSSIHSTSAFFY